MLTAIAGVGLEGLRLCAKATWPSRNRAVNGVWTDQFHGAAFATAMALIVLQLPNNYLPILQK